MRRTVKGAGLLVAALSALALIGCGDEEEEAGSGTIEPTFSSIQTEVFDVSCNFASCHGPTGLKGDLVLAGAGARANLVDVTPDNANAAGAGLLRVKPGDPDSSFLLVKLEEGTPAEFGDQMPQFAGTLGDAELTAIRQWIAQGAEP